MKRLLIVSSMMIFTAALYGCGGGGGNSGGGNGGGGGGSGRLSLSPSITDNEVTGTNRPAEGAQRALTNAGQNLGSVTQSSNVAAGTTLDQVELTGYNGNGPIVTNDRNNDGDVFDAGEWQWSDGTFSRGNGVLFYQYAAVDRAGNIKAPAADDEFYMITGFWYRGADDFGLFVDGTEATYALPTSGTARYNGDTDGVFYPTDADHGTHGLGGRDPSDYEGVFSGDIRFDVTFAATPTITGEITNLGGDDVDVANAFGLRLTGAEWDADARAFTNGDIEVMNCPEPSCLPTGGTLTYQSSWGGQFFSLSPTGDNGRPEIFAGTYGVSGLLGTFDAANPNGVSYNFIGVFGALLEGCTLPACGDN